MSIILKRAEKQLHTETLKFLRHHFPADPYIITITKLTLSPDSYFLQLYLSLYPANTKKTPTQTKKEFFAQHLANLHKPLKQHLAKTLHRTLRRLPRDLHIRLDDTPQKDLTELLYHL